MDEKIKIEKLDLSDVENVFEIEKTFFDVTEKNSILGALKSDTLYCFVLKNENEVIGFLECSIVLDEAELYEIAIKSQFQGKGFSNYLMQFFKDFCKEKNVKTIYLEVNTINSKAISLYKKFDFKEYSVRKNYYGNNDAILMKYDG